MTRFRCTAPLVVVLMATSALAAPSSVEFDLDEQYASVEPAAGDEVLAPGEIDPNALGAGEEMPIPTEDAAPVEAPKPIVKKAPAQRPQPKKVEEEPRDIPLIEMSHESRSHADVTFVTGGIGDDELQAIEAAKADYNLYVMSAATTGAFVGDSRVIIMRTVEKVDEEMLSVTAGPVLYVRLPPGSYTLYAKLGEQTKKQTFTIPQKGAATRVSLSWKQ